LSDFSYEYLPWRGVSADTFRFFKAKTKIDSTGKPVEIGFVYPNESVKVRTLDKKGFYTKGDIAKAGLYSRDRFSAGLTRL